MADNVVRREVQRRDDPFGIPACFYWTMDEVADWVDSIGYGKYKENFRSHFINGRKLLTVDACVLPRMGITNFGDILGLCKHIRELLGIQRHLRDYDPYQPRIRYIQTQQTSGKKHPWLSYKEHANKCESITEARLNYFKRKHICYKGWTMQKGWDRQIRATEAELREEMKKAGTPVEPGKKLIGQSMQERLRIAADNHLSYEEEARVWQPDTGVSARSVLGRIRRPRLLEPPSTNQMGTRIIGHVNWSKIKNIPYVKNVTGNERGNTVENEREKAQKRKEKKAASDKDKQGTPQTDLGVEQVKTGSNKERPTIVVDESTKLLSSDKSKHGEDDRRSERSGASSEGGRSSMTKTKRKSVIRTSVKLKKEIPPYHVDIVYHWEKMADSTGYPPIRLDKLQKCGYYYGETA